MDFVDDFYVGQGCGSYVDFGCGHECFLDFLDICRKFNDKCRASDSWVVQSGVLRWQHLR